MTFYFAWVDPTDSTFDPDVHNVNDEDIFAFTLEHTEGDFATLNLEVRNPRIGLLAASRKVWAWFSWDNGSDVVPLFFGRLIGIPNDIHLEIVTLQFIARPNEYPALKADLAQDLRVAPYYDEVWIDEKRRADPDVVLEARPELWHIDRITHEVTTSNVLVGEDGIVEFGDDIVFRDSVAVNLNNIPLRSVEVDASISWTQGATGAVDVGGYIWNVWPNESLDYHLITTFSGDGLINSWPKAEQGIGGGWYVASGSCEAKQGLAVPHEYEALEVRHGIVVPKAVPPGSIILPTLQATGPASVFLESIVVPLWHLRPSLTVRYDAKRGRTERVRFTLKSDVQPIITLPGEDEALLLELNSVDVGEPLNGTPPIGSVIRRSFLPSVRGLASLEYLIMLARANLMVRSRAVEIKFETAFAHGVDLSLRQSGTLTDDRLPGGEATGKIVGYSLQLDGDSGACTATVTLACSVGYGNAIVTAAGTPDYVAVGYVTEGYQQYTGTIQAVGAGDVGYTVPGDDPQDDGIDFSKTFRAADIITALQITNPPATQRTAILAVKAAPNTLLDEASIREALQLVPTSIRLELLPLTGGPFETPYDITVTDLVLPQGINLEATA